MNGLVAIYVKELMQYFRSPIAYFVVAVFLLGTGYFFLYNIFLTGIGTMDSTLQNMGILLITLVPILTMRLFAGEYSARTMELLMTLPLRAWQIVLGKFLGVMTIFALMVLGTSINLVPLYLYGNPETGTILAGYLGFFLLGTACLALGQFLSALTRTRSSLRWSLPVCCSGFGLSGICRTSRARRCCATCSAICPLHSISTTSSVGWSVAMRWLSIWSQPPSR